MKILIVDDEPGIRFVTRKILEKAGHTVLEAGTGEEGIAKIREARPDLVLLDVIMPDGFGWNLCKRIKEDKEIGGVPVAMFTVRGAAEDVERSRRAGAFTHIKKPFEKEDLYRVIHRLKAPVTS
ncbi:MAG: response regulator [Acidobacteria bacterium]|nr:response regulator [Acidobacteriota bacterium]